MSRSRSKSHSSADSTSARRLRSLRVQSVIGEHNKHRPRLFSKEQIDASIRSDFPRVFRLALKILSDSLLRLHSIAPIIHRRLSTDLMAHGKSMLANTRVRSCVSGKFGQRQASSSVEFPHLFRRARVCAG